VAVLLKLSARFGIEPLSEQTTDDFERLGSTLHGPDTEHPQTRPSLLSANQKKGRWLGKKEIAPLALKKRSNLPSFLNQWRSVFATNWVAFVWIFQKPISK